MEPPSSSCSSTYFFGSIHFTFGVVLHVVDIYDSSSWKTCHVPGWNTSDKLGVLFRTSPRNLHLVLYNCTLVAAASGDGELVRMRCGNGNDAAFVRGAGSTTG